MLFFAQSLGEYAGAGSQAPVGGSLQSAWSTIVNRLSGVDQQTWLIIGGVLLVLVLFTRRSKRH